MTRAPSDELATLDAVAQAALVRDGTCTPRQLVDAAIARIERIDPALNAVITPLFAAARAAADDPDLPAGALRGVPFLVKDLLCETAGDPYHCGMRLLRDAGWRSTTDSHLVTKLRAAGVIILGKTNTPELGSLPTTEPLAYGPARNPWSPAHSTGGSSGGSAAAVASGMVPAAEANDGGGSIRIPASACGLVGLKPTRGRVSLGPAAGELWAGLVCEGVVTRSVRDTAAFLDVIAGGMPGDPYVAPPPARPFADEVGAGPGRLRIGVLTDAPSGQSAVHPDCVAAAHEAAALLATLGHVVDGAYPAGLGELGASEALFVVVGSWLCRDLDHWAAATGRAIGPDTVEPHNLAMAEAARRYTAADYIRAVEWLQARSRAVAQWWAAGHDLLLTPTLGEPPPPLGELRSTPADPFHASLRSASFVPFTPAFNVTGQPAISLPLAWNADGLPIGVQLVAAMGREDLLLRVAAQLEQARPWAARLPRVHASRV